MDDLKEDLQQFCIEIIKNKDDELLESITNLMDFVKDNLSKNDKILKILEASPRMFFYLDKKQQANIENIKVALENFTTVGHDFLELIPTEYFKDKDWGVTLVNNVHKNIIILRHLKPPSGSS